MFRFPIIRQIFINDQSRVKCNGLAMQEKQDEMTKEEPKEKYQLLSSKQKAEVSNYVNSDKHPQVNK